MRGTFVTLSLINRLLGTTFATGQGETGSGAIVRASSPTLVTPALGTPSALVLTNATGLPAAERLKVKVAAFSRDMTAATGSVGYTGAGFTPKKVTVYGTTTAAAGTVMIGVYDGTSQYNLHNITDPAIDGVLAYVGSGGNDQRLAGTSLDADGFTGTWTKNGAPGGTFSGVIVYEG